MKRDLDLIREILLEVEATSDGKAARYEAADLSTEKSHQVQLAIQAGLLKEVGAVRSSQRLKVHLTWEGHDYLDAVREGGIWQKTKEVVAEQGGSATLEIVKAVAPGFLEKQIEDRTGMKP